MSAVLIAVAVLVVVVALVAGAVAATRRRDHRALPGEAPPAPPVAVGEPPPEVVAPVEALPGEAPGGGVALPETTAVPEVAEADDGPDRSGTAPAPVRERPRLRDRLGRTRAAFSGAFGGLRGRAGIDDETWDELEEALILADVGGGTTAAILDDLRTTAKEQRITDGDTLLARLKEELVGVLGVADRSLGFEPGRPNVWMFVGVNGVGKTTTIAKFAQKEEAAGRRVVLAAADTFRAAAAEQLAHWADRVGAHLVRGQDGADPGSVVFDAMAAAGNRSADLVLVDTAGRLHTNVNLMEELKKLRRIVERTPGALREVLLVIDASTGQNGLNQAREFTDAVDVTGVVLTKLDGTAKGGIVLAIHRELGIPVKWVGVGEGVDDLVPFDPEEFVEAIFA